MKELEAMDIRQTVTNARREGRGKSRSTLYLLLWMSGVSENPLHRAFKTTPSSLAGKTVGEWQLTRFLGNGNSAAVFVGRREKTDSAVKVYFPTFFLDPSGAEVEEKRIRLQTKLRGHGHPHLIDILDAGVCNDTGLHYVVMPLVTARNLTDQIGEIPRKAIRLIIKQIASAAAFLEQRGIVHRDIKPDNIVFDPITSHATLLDLGVIRHIGNPSGTEEARFVGTPQYSPPEFASSAVEDTPEGWRSVTYYQIGAVLYDLIERRPIFQSVMNNKARFYRALDDTMPSITATDVDSDLIELSLGCLKKNWIDRLEFTWDAFGVEAPIKTESNKQPENLNKAPRDEQLVLS